MLRTSHARERAATALRAFHFYDSGTPRTARGTILFIHGFPDDHRVWNRQITFLKESYRCVTVDLPGFGKAAHEEISEETCGFEPMVERFLLTLRDAGVAERESVHVVGHDWGAVYAYLLTRSAAHRVRSLTTLEVGARVGRQGTLLADVLLPTYQLSFAASHLLGQIPGWGPWGARILGNLTGAGLKVLSQREEGTPRSFSGGKVTPSMCYPYAYFWKSLAMRRPMSFRVPDGIPFFFAYGKAGLKKAMSFHDDGWLNEIQNRPQTRVVEYAQAGHWIMLDEADAFNEELASFLRTAEA